MTPIVFHGGLESERREDSRNGGENFPFDNTCNVPVSFEMIYGVPYVCTKVLQSVAFNCTIY